VKSAMDCRSKEHRRPISSSRSKPRVNPLLAKENPHKEHEVHKRLLVSTALHKRSMGHRREIVFLARWLAEVHPVPAPVLVNSRLTGKLAASTDVSNKPTPRKRA
jgi:hypothetical protein